MGKIDVVYLCKAASPNEHLEMRYSMRSLVKYGFGYNKVFVVGHAPHWLKGATHIEQFDAHQNKEQNILAKILTACRDKRISESFCLVNDDQFLLQNSYLPGYPNLYDGDIIEELSRRKSDPRTANSLYNNTVSNTLIALNQHKMSTCSFSLHAPFRINKTRFMEMVPLFDWDQEGSLCINSIYYNFTGALGRREKDCKVPSDISEEELRKVISGRRFFSTSHAQVGPGVISMLNKLYPKESPWEK